MRQDKKVKQAKAGQVVSAEPENHFIRNTILSLIALALVLVALIVWGWMNKGERVGVDNSIDKLPVVGNTDLPAILGDHHGSAFLSVLIETEKEAQKAKKSTNGA